MCQLLLEDLWNEKVVQGMRPRQYDVSNTRPLLMGVVYGASSRKKENINCLVNGAVGPHSGVTRCDSDLVSLSDMMSLDETVWPRRKKRQN